MRHPDLARRARPNHPTPPLGDSPSRLRAGEDVTLFSDEYREPIRADDLAAELWALAAMPTGERAGIWHLPAPSG